MNHHIPGYGGYIRTYQRESVTGKDIPAHKYEDIAPDHHSLMHHSQWRSVYTDTIKASPGNYQQPDDGGARARWEMPLKPLPDTPGTGFFGSTYRATMNAPAGGMQPQRTQSAPSISSLSSSLAKPLLSGNHLSHAGARVMTPPSAMTASTSYPPDIQARIQSSINAERTSREHEHAQRQYETIGRQQSAVTQSLSQIPHAQNLLRATWGTSSSYQQDYGKSGTRPSDRYPASSTTPTDLSRTATTQQLFLGSAKGSIRIPNYSGHVPSSHVNTTHLKNTPNINQDAIILTSYRHDLPGYSGYAIGTTHGIQNVSNDRGPRTPRGKRQVDQGLQASLILDSMKI